MEMHNLTAHTLLQRPTQKSDAVLTVAFVTSILSSLGALFIIVNWVLVRSSRIFFLKLIVFLSIANLLSSASYIMAYIDAQVTARGPDCDAGSGDGLVVDCPPDAGCLVQAMLMLIFENASVFWTVAIAYTLHEQVERSLRALTHAHPRSHPRSHPFSGDLGSFPTSRIFSHTPHPHIAPTRWCRSGRTSSGSSPTSTRVAGACHSQSPPCYCECQCVRAAVSASAVSASLCRP